MRALFLRLVHRLFPSRGKATQNGEENKRRPETVKNSSPFSIPHDLQVPLNPLVNSLADDRLDSAGEIAAYYFGSDTPENRKRAYRLKEKGAPIGKRGRNIISTKQKLAAWDDALTNGFPLKLEAE